MTTDEELEALRQANTHLLTQVANLTQALTTATETISSLPEQVKHLQEQQAKDSHNSSLPPSSDRFVRRPKSFRKKSGKKAGGQAGHLGHHLRQVAIPDEIVRHRVERCEHCACDVSGQQASVPERRQVFDLPSKRLWVVEHQAEEKVDLTRFWRVETEKEISDSEGNTHVQSSVSKRPSFERTCTWVLPSLFQKAIVLFRIHPRTKVGCSVASHHVL